MKIMIDSNVLVSAVYNPNSKPAHAVRDVCENHELFLCDHIVAECYDVVGRKFPQHTPILDKLLTSLGYSLVIAPRGGSAHIADPKDAPILNVLAVRPSPCYTPCIENKSALAYVIKTDCPDGKNQQ